MLIGRISLLAAVLLAVSGAFAASPAPVWAKHAMVSSAEPLATQVGVDVLLHGGNAVDAAAAVALALGVTEGYSSGIGGGCFILIRLADGTEVAIDGRETAPGKASRLMYVPADTTQPSTLSMEGVLAAATPGELAALDLAVRTYGRLPFAQVMDGAIALADTGFELTMRYARALTLNAALLRKFEATHAVFFESDTIPLGFGDRLIQTDLAGTLRRVQAHGVEEFYRGDIPLRVDAFMKSHGGVLSARDFAKYQPVVRQPVRTTWKNLEVISMPPPSSGGIHLIQILSLLEPFDLKSLGAGSSESVHLMAEAMQLAFADRAEFLGDPGFVKVPVTGLINPRYLAERRSRINRSRHDDSVRAGDPWAYDTGPAGEDRERHTTHLCVVDSFGNAVSLTATINTPFGSGVIVPRTGFLLNNEMDDFVTVPGRPNYFGLVGNAANEIEPGKRPLSSLSPTVVLRDGKPFIVIGSMGGPRIITSVVLALLNVVEFGMNLQEAVDFPRMHQQWVPDELYLEPEYSTDVQTALQSRGHHVRVQPRWAAVTAIMADTVYGGWWGTCDSRVTGLAKGF